MVKIDEFQFDPDIIATFHQAAQWPFARTSHKGVCRTFNLKEVVTGLNRVAADSIEIRLKRTNGKTLRPHDLLKAVFSLSADQIRAARIVKLFENMPDNG